MSTNASGENDARAILDRALDAILGGHYAEALQLAREACVAIDAAAIPDRELRAEAWHRIAWCLARTGWYEEAAQWYSRLREADPADLEVDYGMAHVHLDRWELEDAERLLERASPSEALRANALWSLAIVAELRGDDAKADLLYQEAARIDPQRCPSPVRLSDAEAAALLRSVITRLPQDVRHTLKNVVIDVHPMPGDAEAPFGVLPTTLGVYETGSPQRIRIYKRNIERFAADEEELRRELEITLLHEIGHHLGFNEAELRQRGL